LVSHNSQHENVNRSMTVGDLVVKVRSIDDDGRTVC